jgi:hypothetical protein
MSRSNSLSTVNLSNTNNISTNLCHLIDSFDKNNQFLPKFDNFSCNMKTPNFKKIVILIDTSGSTNNTGGSRGCSSRGGYSSVDTTNTPSETISETKIILLAELEGTAHVLFLLAQKYNLNGILLIILTFDSTVNKYTNTLTLTSSDELVNIANSLPAYVGGMFSSTATDRALKTAMLDNEISPTFEDTYLILSTDGQPNDKPNTLAVMNDVVAQYSLVKKNITLISIGAGSIQQSATGSAGRYCTRHGDQTEFRANLPSTSSYSECDNGFLINLVSSVGEGCYLPSFKDYSVLKQTFNDFLNHTNVAQKWQIDLGDNNQYNWVNMDDEISQLLEINEPLINISNRGSYLLIPNTNTQLRVSLIDSNEIQKEDIPEDILNMITPYPKLFYLDSCVSQIISSKSEQLTYSSTFNYSSDVNIIISIHLQNNKYICKNFKFDLISDSIFKMRKIRRVL